MDIPTQQRLDELLSEELRRGFRIKDLPLDLQLMVKADGLPEMKRLKFTRLNPRRKSRIAEAVQDRYHKDLNNPAILSNEQIAKLVDARGEWTKDQADRMFALLDETQRLQSELYIDGLGEGNWDKELLEAADKLRAEIEKTEYKDPEEQKKVLEVLDRWSGYSPARKEAYTLAYAAEQALEQYSPDRDLAWLLDRVPSEEAAEALQILDDLRDKAIRFMDLQTKRRELVMLQNKHAKIFADSVESRRDQTEEMARVFFCTEQVDEQDNRIGTLCKDLDSLWDYPEELIRWLIVEHYFFANGLPDAARDYLETFGFLRADREKSEATTPDAGVSEPSVASPDPQSSKDDTTQQAATAAKSSE